MGYRQGRKGVDGLKIVSALFYLLASVVLLIALVIVIMAGLWLLNIIVSDMTGTDYAKEIGGKHGRKHDISDL